jgi:hypothetical protein
MRTPRTPTEIESIFVYYLSARLHATPATLETKRMPKKMIDGAPQIGRPTGGDGAPPLLSEKLIAQLQGAVEAAQRRRNAPQANSPQKFATDSKDESTPNQ